MYLINNIMIFAKYQFPDINIWNNLKKSIQSEDVYIDCAAVELGHLCQEKDEEGNCINLDSNYAIDIMWYKEIPQAFNDYEVFPEPCGVHTFAGCEDLYKQRYCEFFPDYCNADEAN